MAIKALVVCAALLSTSVWAFVVPQPAAIRKRASLHMQISEAFEGVHQSRRDTLQHGAGVITGVAVASGLTSQPAFAKGPQAWAKVPLPVEETLFDISFDTKDANHGWIVGSRGTFLETFDGGANWGARSFSNLDAEEEINYRFQTASFSAGEGWIIGKPPILLHTTDSGKSFERIPLSPKLPGEPMAITALGPAKAEMTTTSGAVYVTENAGRNWKAQVKETIDATLNRVSSSGVQGASYFTGSVVTVQRDSAGAYVAVSSRGNFYLTWAPGQDYWAPHNRGTSRRIQSMGFIKDNVKNGMWMTLNGGLLQVTDPGVDITAENSAFKPVKINSGGYGILDVAWKDDNEVWAVGGSGAMFLSRDGGKTWEYNSSADNLPGNLYRVKFFGENKGFILGSDGILLRYTGEGISA